MKKGQGSLEYLLILAAILAIAVVVIVVANSMMAPGTNTAKLNSEKYTCTVAGIELREYMAIPATVNDGALTGKVYQNGNLCTAGSTGASTATCALSDGSGNPNTLTVKYGPSACTYAVTTP